MKVCRKKLKVDKKLKTKPHQANIVVEYILYTATSKPTHKSQIKYQQQGNYYGGRYRCICKFNECKYINQIKNEDDSILPTKSKLRTYTNKKGGSKS